MQPERAGQAGKPSVARVLAAVLLMCLISISIRAEWVTRRVARIRRGRGAVKHMDMLI